MRVRAVVWMTVLAWSLTACSSGGRPHATPSSSVTVDSAGVAPLKIGTWPLWTDQTKGVPRYADEATVHGDSVIVVSGPKSGEADRLSVMDAATGRFRWSAAPTTAAC